MYINTWIRKIWRDVWSYKLRSALVCTSVFIGVLGIVVLTTMGQLLTRQLHADIDTDQLAMLRIYLRIPPDTSINGDPRDLSALEAVPGVTDVEAQAAYEFAWKKPEAETFQTGQVFAYSEDFDDIDLEPFRLVAGSYPETGKNELLIEQRMAAAHDLHVGDRLRLQIVDPQARKLETWEITGIVFQPYIYVGSGSFESAVFTTYDNAQEIAGFRGYSSIYVRFENMGRARQLPPRFYEILNRQTPYRVVFHLVDDPEENTFIIGVERFSRVLMILSVVAMVVSSFLVTNVINTLLAEQRRQIGAMKAVGATYFDIVRMYLGVAFTYGVIGTIPAVILGAILGHMAAEAVAPLANTYLRDESVSWLAIGLGVLLGVGIPMLAAIVPIYQTAGVSIVDAMTDQGIKSNFGKNFGEALLRKLPLKLEIQQALNNVIRQRGRLLLTMFALSLAVAAFMGMYAVFDSLNRVIGNIRESLDYEVTFSPEDFDAAGAFQDILNTDGEQIRSIEPGVAIELTVLPTPRTAGLDRDQRLDEGGVELPANQLDPDAEPARLVVTGIDTTALPPSINLVEGDAWQDDPDQSGVVITPAIARRLDKAVGDVIVLKSPNHTRAFRVTGIAEFPVDTALMEWQQLEEFVGVIRQAPVPNNYWDTVQIETETENALTDQDIWSIGISESVGKQLTPDFTIGRRGVIISQAVAEAGGYQVGDSIRLETDAEAFSYIIWEIFEIDPMQLQMISSDIPAAVQESLTAQDGDPRVIAMHWEALAAVEGLDYGELSPTMFYVDLANPTALETTDPNAAPAARVVAVHENQVAFADRIAQTIIGVGLVMNFASMMMGVVGAIGLLTITSIGVFERQREIGVMRSVGATSSNILFQFLAEGLLVGVAAWLIGMPISYLLSQVLINSVPFHEVITFEYPLLAPLFGLIGIIVITIGATLYPSLSAARKTVSEILRYQ